MLHDDDDVLSPVLGRRNIIQGAGAFGLLALARMAAARRAPDRVTEDAALDFSDLADEPSAFQSMCVLAPAMTEGPYYLPLNLLRTDITEGYAGLPTRVALNIVRASDCSPVVGATVDLWHNNAPGTYSGFAAQGTAGLTYLRGIQVTDANGFAYFDTIYPGWYPGRTTHMHLKVRPVGGAVLTTQLYFPMRLNRRVYTIQPYAAHGQNPTTNQGDGIFNAATIMSLLPTPPPQGGIQVGITIGIA